MKPTLFVITTLAPTPAFAHHGPAGASDHALPLVAGIAIVALAAALAFLRRN